MRDRIFKSKNIISQEKIKSPSKRFKLIIQYYKDRNGSCNYSRGRLYRLSDNRPIYDIKKDYHNFNYDFVEKDGQEWIIAGTSCFNQVIINLDTCNRFDLKEFDEGSFCWSRCSLSPDGNILAVHGCIWACPYEIRFFDFSNPENGWKELEMDMGTMFASPEEEFFWDPDNRFIVLYNIYRFTPLDKLEEDISPEEIEYIGDFDFDYEGNWEKEIHRKRVIEFSEGKMVYVDLWKSDYLKSIEEKKEKHKSEWEEWERSFTSTDSLYLYASMLFNNIKVPGNKYKYWSGNLKSKKGLFSEMSFYGLDTYSYPRATIRWGVYEGPIQVRVINTVHDFNSAKTIDLDRNEEGLIEAFGKVSDLFEKG